MGIEDGVSDDIRVVTEKSLPADASAFGLGAFAGTMFILSSYLAGWAPDVTWVTVALFYGGLGQFVAGMWQYKRNCVFSSTSFSTYGCFWLSLGLFYCFKLWGWMPRDYDVSGAEAWFLVAFLLFNTYMLAAAFTLSVVNVVVFGLYELTLVLLIIGDFKGQPVDGGASWITAGGYVGVFTSVAAWYASFAVLFNGMVNREIMYLGKPLINIKKEE
ncbi:hypothetical protein CLOM_g24333 [Closterium sp. NIES-68]|nr:hypothetical protein CLOM_g24333 [Closterium sp. NIES-68]GJP84796.1 hypothetical protein CLOP_g14848 [Closterium sp. NIES-67]